jgi:putative Ca2+/H+ antiporter (TMEM165/GDT1 family)
MAGVLFLVFGSKMVMEGKEMEGKGREKVEEEMRESSRLVERMLALGPRMVRPSGWSTRDDE